jgi:hypothetical protein
MTIRPPFVVLMPKRGCPGYAISPRLVRSSSVYEDPEDVRELLETERLYFGDLHLLASALSEEVAYLTVHQQG